MKMREITLIIVDTKVNMISAFTILTELYKQNLMHDYNLVPRTDITEIRFEYCLTTGGLCEALLDLREGTAYHVLASIAVSMCSDAEVLARHVHPTLLIWVHKEAHRVQSHLQFRTCTDKHGANRFHDIGPLVVQFQNCSFLEHNLKSLSPEST